MTALIVKMESQKIGQGDGVLARRLTRERLKRNDEENDDLKRKARDENDQYSSPSSW